MKKRHIAERRQDTFGSFRRTASVVCILAAFAFPLFSLPASGQEDVIRIVEAKRIELKEKEEALKREEERLTTLRKEVDEKIAMYTKLLVQVEATAKKVESIKGEKIENVVKAYEVMAPEDAAARISALDENTALQIMTRMKSKKAGAIIAVMAPRKAASLTRRMAMLPVKGQRQ